MLALAAASSISAQAPSTLHIVTKKKNLPSPLRFNFELNGKPYRLKGGDCLELSWHEDSVHLVLFDRRLLKKPTLDLHIASEKELYILVYYSFEGYLKEGRFVAESVCKSCFEEVKPQCK